MPLTDYMETRILQSIIDMGALQVALFTAAPGDATAGTEVTGGTYAQQQVTFEFAPGSVAAIRNSLAIVFTGLPACTVVAIAIMDGSGPTANRLIYGTLPQPVTYAAGVNATIDAAALQFTLD